MVQKWYVQTPSIPFVDREHFSMDVRCYFMPLDIERTRGVLACMPQEDKVIPRLLRTLRAHPEICRAILRQRRRSTRREDDPEGTTHRLHVQPLSEL